MDQKHELSSDRPWLIAHNLDPEEDDTGDQIFFTIHDPISRFRCRIPALVGRCIRGCFHGWMILSKRNPNNIEWSLWNPDISKLIYLPPWILKDKDDEDDFKHCCLTSPPDDPGSILLLMRSTKPNIVFINCKRRKKSKRWTEMSYSKQMKKIPSNYGNARILFQPTCCNGNIYVRSGVSYRPLLIQLQIVVKEKQTVITLLPLVRLPHVNGDNFVYMDFFLKESCTQLFAIGVGETKEEVPSHVSLFKLDMGSMKWTEINDLKDTISFVHPDTDYDLVYSSPPIASESGGGYVHILKEQGDVIYSYNIKDKTISMSLTHRYDLPLCSISVWPTMPEFRLPKCKDGDHDDRMVMVTSATATSNDDDDDDDDGETKNEECLLIDIPFHVLEMMMKYSVGIEYLNFRATCKRCHLAAPMIQWSNERLRLGTYSLVSPWLMVMDKRQGIITFTDPVFGDNEYFIKASPELFYDDRILCSRYGWLLLYIAQNCLVFFNPFTSDILKLPPIPYYESFSFSAPPTSPDCMVLASRLNFGSVEYCVHHVGREPFIWHRFSYEFDVERLHFSWFPTIFGKDVYSLFNSRLPDGGGLEVFREIDNHDHNPCRTQIVDLDIAPLRISANYYHMKCDEHHLLVTMGKYGESVEVFKLNECKREWEKIDGLGSHMIYICKASCVCMKAKIPEMGNKIYFPRLHFKKDKIVFYSMETCKFHMFNGRKMEQNILTDFFGTKRTVYAHAWIEPTWS